MTDASSSASCSWPGCPKFGKVPATTDDPLLKCGRCKQAWYCKKSCQKSHWTLHKITCSGAPRHCVAGTTLEAIQSCLDAAQAGDIVEIPEGDYRSSSEAGAAKLTIKKAVHLIGAGMSKVTLHASLNIQGNEIDGKMVIANLKVKGNVSVQENKYNGVTFVSVEVECPPSSRDDAFSIKRCGGKVLIFCCEIIGGSDGLGIYGANVHIKETDISFAASRGIFANDSFLIEDSTVSNCGGYGIKGRDGWDERGTNHLQPGPWSSFGGPTDMY
jgi:hypothetical protein